MSSYETENVISTKSADKHNISKYNFMVLDPKEVRHNPKKFYMDKAQKEKLEQDYAASLQEPKQEPVRQESPKQETSGQEPQNNGAQQPQNGQSQQGPGGTPGVSMELMEKLLNKSDELANSLNAMQESFDKQQQEFETRLQEETKKAFDAGKKEGVEESEAQKKEELEQIKMHYFEAISKLDGSSQEYQDSLLGIEKELSSIAIDIAKEVIAKDIEKSSKTVALKLAKVLMHDLKEASKAKIKVNPADYEFVKSKMGEDAKISITADKMITKGGVIILSDSGNIDGTIESRFNALKAGILENQQVEE